MLRMLHVIYFDVDSSGDDGCSVVRGKIHAYKCLYMCTFTGVCIHRSSLLQDEPNDEMQMEALGDRTGCRFFC
jgi:hypothetical protein